MKYIATFLAATVMVMVPSAAHAKCTRDACPTIPSICTGKVLHCAV